MKYRRLTQEELEPLHEEFLKYLLVANITPEKWTHLKQEQHPSCQKHLDTFSDLVLDKILQDVKFVNIVLGDRLEVYQFTNKKAYLFILENKTINTQDLSEIPLKDLDINSLNLIKGEKELKEREQEIFEILKRKGASISEGSLFKQIALFVAQAN